jgi:hypothetical protein
MKKIVFKFILILLSVSALGALDIQVSPKTPLAGEAFSVSFIVKSVKSVNPFVSFEPSGVEVIGRSSSYSTSTEFINGRSSTKRQTILRYEMISDTPRTARLTNISVDVGDETYTHKNISISIKKKSKKDKQKVFVHVEVSNENPYVGEGVDVRYYLYTRVDIPSEDIVEFPKLNGFIKRFPKVRENVETVEHNGLMYRRVLRYPVRVFAEKSGVLKIDSLKMSVHYVASSSRGVFGRRNNVKKKSIRSDVIKITVRDLPVTNVPRNFTGLVGKHEAKLVLTKRKYLINEPVEVRLEVVGPGALEKMDAPVMFDSDALESFDTKAVYNDINIKTGRKVFDYTYLVRKAAILKKRTIELAYFNITKDTYENMLIEVPELIFGGSAVAGIAKKSDVDTNSSDSNIVKSEEKTIAPSDMAGPMFFKNLKDSSFKISVIFKYLMYFAVALVFILIATFFLRLNKHQKHENLVSEIIKNGLTYKKLTILISKLPGSSLNGDIKSIVNLSNLSKEYKTYFLSIIKDIEDNKYSENAKGGMDIDIDRAAFKAVLVEINK